ncbi:glycoside hydrolase family 13 protein [Moniliophthora roreri]|nr:glycoside hydrolase family 13 protein [Moniliophthora roreri]
MAHTPGDLEGTVISQAPNWSLVIGWEVLFQSSASPALGELVITTFVLFNGVFPFSVQIVALDDTRDFWPEIPIDLKYSLRV